MMREFFNGWRSKTGLLTLLLASMVMGVWLRSRLVEDQIVFARWNALHILESENGAVAWLAIEMTADEVRASRFAWQSSPIRSFDEVEQKDFDTKWLREWKFCGLSFGEDALFKNGETLKCKGWGIFYASITIPLAVISAWMLHSDSSLFFGKIRRRGR